MPKSMATNQPESRRTHAIPFLYVYFKQRADQDKAKHVTNADHFSGSGSGYFNGPHTENDDQSIYDEQQQP